MRLFRRNRFNEKVEVERYTCGSCKYYDFDDERYKNRCTDGCSYSCYYTDHCNDWEESDELE